MLPYSPDSNHLQWCKEIEGVGNLKYGSFASDVATSDCQKKLRPETTTSSRQQELIQYQNEVAGYNYELKAAKEKMPKLYFFMWEHMSSVFQDAVKSRPDFEEFMLENLSVFYNLSNKKKVQQTRLTRQDCLFNWTYLADVIVINESKLADEDNFCLVIEP